MTFNGEMWICDVQSSITAMGGGGDPPPAPDPAKTAAAQSAANEATARTQFKLNAIDDHSPTGSVTWRQPGSVFNQQGYDSAMRQYETDLSAFNAAGGAKAPVEPRMVGYTGDGAPIWDNTGISNGRDAPVMPTREQFTTGGEDKWER